MGAVDRANRSELHDPAASERELVTTLLPRGEALLGAREAAAILGVCRDTVYQMCAAGELDHFRVRNRIRICASALRSYLDAARGGKRS